MKRSIFVLMVFVLGSMPALPASAQPERGRKARDPVSVERLESRMLLAVNPVVLENQLPGTPRDQWFTSGDGDTSIQGYATDISVDQGGTVNFKVNDPSNAPYRLDIYRLGYYNGQGARKIATIQPSATLPQTQPTCLTDASTGLFDCGNWTVSASWA